MSSFMLRANARLSQGPSSSGVSYAEEGAMRSLHRAKWTISYAVEPALWLFLTSPLRYRVQIPPRTILDRMQSSAMRDVDEAFEVALSPRLSRSDKGCRCPGPCMARTHRVDMSWSCTLS